MAEKRTTTGPSGSRLDDVVARARGERDDRMKGYREMSLKLHPWVCGRCSREFTRENLSSILLRCFIIYPNMC